CTPSSIALAMGSGHHYVFLIITLVLYFSAFFNIKYLFIFSPRFNYLLSIVLYLVSLPLPLE
ncbi:hypothetical protein, partial [Escherichia coli]|uniref:hypothetical protein n=1 Tax=Escherichia coli TaxID=562 RepID=UPI001953DC07